MCSVGRVGIRLFDTLSRARFKKLVQVKLIDSISMGFSLTISTRILQSARSANWEDVKRTAESRISMCSVDLLPG